MIPTPPQYLLQAFTLSMVAGTPLLLALLCCTPCQNTILRYLPWTVVPAVLTVITAPVDLIVEVPWFFMGGRMGLDETGRIFLSFSAFIWFLASFSCHSLLIEDKEKTRFLVFFLSAMAGNFGLILARGMLGYYLFFAVMSFAAYGLVVHKETDEAAKAGRIYLTLLMIGEVSLFTALIILAHITGSLAIEDIAGSSYHPLLLALLFIGFGVKTGALPVHGWMVPSYQAAPIPAAAVLAGAMVNAGILGWLRFFPPGHTSCPQGAMLFITAGTLAAVYGVIAGLGKNQIGAILACSSISQMGLITVIFGLGLLGHEAGLYAAPVLMLYIVHHSLAKSSLFFAYDFVGREGRPVARSQMALILLPALALTGLPFTSGAVAKTAFKELVMTLGEPWYSLSTVFLPLTAMGTTMLVLHFMSALKDTGQAAGAPGTKAGRTIFYVSIAAVAIPVWLWPAARNSASHSLAGAKLLQGLWPVTGGWLLFLVWRRITSRKKIPVDNHGEQRDVDAFFLLLQRTFQEKEWQKRQYDGFSSFLQRFIPYLRRTEKMMGRWKVVGLSYLALCLYLLVLLL